MKGTRNWIAPRDFSAMPPMTIEYRGIEDLAGALDYLNAMPNPCLKKTPAQIEACTDCVDAGFESCEFDV